MASVRHRRRRHRARWIAGAGALLVISGLGLLLGDAQSRLDAAERVISLTAEEREFFGEDADAMVGSFVVSSLIQSLVSGSGTPTFDVTVTEAGIEGREVSIMQSSSSMVSVFDGSWHAAPAAIPVIAGIALLVVALFERADRWRPQPDAERRN